jgi:hypothetical protein
MTPIAWCKPGERVLYPLNRRKMTVVGAQREGRTEVVDDRGERFSISRWTPVKRIIRISGGA